MAKAKVKSKAKSKGKAVSAGLLMYAMEAGQLRVLLAHPGGPYFAKKDAGAWSIPKGLVDTVAEGDEDLLATAKREFVEETGYELNVSTEYQTLGQVTLKSGKIVHAWAFQGDWEAGRVPASNLFSMEWPPRSGDMQDFPEIDRAEMFSIDQGNSQINERQRPFLDRLVAWLEAASQ